MSDIAINIKGLSKRYSLDAFSFANKVSKFLGASPDASPSEFWALNDINLSIKSGSMVGVIGKNGAGKSTLLKILSKITAPTKGSALIKGRVASLLEVGTGFHPELSGRENIYLNGAILGMTRKEINKQLDPIIEFASINQFIDQPVKKYSSGMYVRLAFAVAAHLQSDVLLVDEVLAVGDIEFQKKCLAQTESLSRQGRTILFVSHNIGAISRLCPNSIFLEHGNLKGFGKTSQIISDYLDSATSEGAQYFHPPTSSGPVQLIAVRIRNAKGELNQNIAYKDSFHIEIDYQINSTTSGVSIGIGLGTFDHLPVLVSADYDPNPSLLGPRKPGRYQASVTIPGSWLNLGRYAVGAYLTNLTTKETYAKVEAINFTIEDTGAPSSHQGANFRKGILQPILKWDTVSC